MIERRDPLPLDRLIDDEDREEKEEGLLGEDPQKKPAGRKRQIEGSPFFEREVEKKKTEHRPEEHQQIAPPDHPDDAIHVQRIEREQQRDDLGEIEILRLPL